MATLAQIYIHDTQKAKSAADNLAASATELESVKISIQNIINELGQYWSQTQQDAQAFATSLNSHVEFLDGFVNNSKKLSYIVTNYIDTQERISTNTIK